MFLLLEAASRVELAPFAKHLQYFDYGQQLLETELSESGVNPTLSSFLSSCELESAQLRGAYESARV